MGSLFPPAARMPATRPPAPPPPPSPPRDLPPAPRLPFVRALGHDLLAGFQTASGDDGRAFGERDRDRPRLDALIGLDDVDVRPLCAALHGGGGNRKRVMQNVDLQPGVDELVGEERTVVVVEYG